MKVSDCCHAPVYVAGGVTMYYVCTKCKKPCDVVKGEEVGHKQ